jgi:hypothetical protein
MKRAYFYKNTNLHENGQMRVPSDNLKTSYFRMKKMNIYIGLLLVILATSCSDDFLEKIPYDKKVAENFYSTSTDAFEGVVSVYDMMQYAGWDAPIILAEVASDNCLGGSGAGDGPGLQNIDRFDVGNINSYEDLWIMYYKGIYRANVVLENIDNVTWTQKETGLKDKYIAEVRFLRAFYYFNLVQLFGNVPLVTKTLAPEDANIPQATPEEVYKYIAEDLKFAVETLPAVSFTKIPQSEYGRVTKWAAEGLLARVFLYYTGYYGKTDLAGVITKSDARNYLDDVINNSGYGLLDKFEDLWEASPTYAGEDNKETVFAIKYTYKNQSNIAWSQHDGNVWQVMIGCRAKNYPPFGKGWGFAPVTPNLYYSYDPADTRQNGSIIHWDTLMAHDPNVKPYDLIDQREWTSMLWKKYMPKANSEAQTATEELGGNFMINNYTDQIIIRYADILLMAAELHLDDNLGLSQSYFNQVRQRAFRDQYAGKEKTLSNNSTGIQLLMEERRHEFALEGLRYWDLLRQGIDVTERTIDGMTTTVISGGLPPSESVSIFRPETKGLFPIPLTQIILSNGVLKQNPGWE